MTTRKTASVVSRLLQGTSAEGGKGRMDDG